MLIKKGINIKDVVKKTPDFKEMIGPLSEEEGSDDERVRPVAKKRIADYDNDNENLIGLKKRKFTPTFTRFFYKQCFFSTQPGLCLQKVTYWAQIVLKCCLFYDCLEHDFDDFNQLQ